MKKHKIFETYVTVCVITSVFLTICSAVEPSMEIPSEIIDLFKSTHSISKDSAGLNSGKQFSEGGTHDLDTHSQKTAAEKIADHGNKTSIGGNATHLMTGLHNESVSNGIVSGGINKISHTLKNSSLNEKKETLENLDALLHTQGRDDSNTSSIKPRKGVDLSDLPPKVSDDEIEKSLPLNTLCDVTNNSRCFNMTKCPHVECYCCNETSSLGIMMGKPSTINCSMCKPNSDICCLNNTKVIKATENTHISNNNATLNGNSSYLSTVRSDNATKKDNIILYQNISNKMENLVDNLANKTKKVHHKPLFTKVPYESEDAENVTYKSKSKIVIPIIVSLLTVPVIAVLLVFICKKASDFWNNRQYRRMDFLIDGIYND